MSIWLKLTVPIILGICAASCNYVLMFMYSNPMKFVATKEDVDAGDEVLSKLELIEVPGHAQSLLKSAVSGDDYANLLAGRRAARPLKKGDLLLWQDVVQPVELKPRQNEDALTLSLDGVAVIPQLMQPGQQITFVTRPQSDEGILPNDSDAVRSRDPELVGPFRLLSVGSRLNRASADAKRGDSTGREITVAIPATSGQNVDAKTKRLLRSIVGTGREQSAIKAIILRQSEADSATGDGEP